MRKSMWLAAASVLVPIGAVAQTTGPAPAAGQTPAADTGATPIATQDEASEEGDIIVTGSRNLPGSVVGDIPPEVQLGPADIRSYGVNSVAELLTELAPQTGSGRGGGGQPVVLLNGRRISGFSEIRDLPTEAIQRVDILPEEVALKYGYRADQRVVNFVTRRRFRAATVEATGRVTTDGGREDGQGELDLLSIRRDERVNLHLSYREQAALTEAERDIIATPSNASIAGNVLNGGGVIAGVPAGAAAGPVGLGTFLGTGQTATDPTPFRTFNSTPARQTFSANAVYARSIFGNIGASLNARVDTSNSEGLNGLPTAALGLPQGNPFSPFPGAVTIARAVDTGTPLTQRSSSVTGHLGTTFNGQLGTWNWSLTGEYDRIASKTFTEIGVDATGFQARLNTNDPGANPFGVLTPALIGPAVGNRAQSTSSRGQVDALLFGRLFALPAGDVSTSVRVGAETQDLDSRAFRTGLLTRGQISRDTVNGQANIDVPIASRRNDFLSALGQFSLNFNLAADELSDFGTLTTIGYGANWAPIPAIRVIASVTDQDEAPSAQQLGNPVVTTPNVRVFDYVQGTTATVTTISGGNPGLLASNRDVSKIALTLKPWSETDFTMTADYTRQRSENSIENFPTPTAIIESVFPDRFVRDGVGQLIRLDSRPINFAERERSQLRWGFNWSKPVRSAIQRQLAAFRAGTGPNPFAGLTPPGGRRPGAEGAAPPAAGAAPTPGAGQGGEGGEGRGGRGGGQGGQGGGFGGRGFGGGGFGGGGGGQGGGRIQFALYHTWRFTDRVLIADGGPELDLLRGDAIGGSGGSARHELEAQAGYSNNGIGIRAEADYRSATQVVGGTAAVPTTLNFGSLTTFELRVFADLGQRLDLVRRYPWVRGMRVQFGVDNVFNTRQRVTDAAGDTPIGFQPAYQDPLGRTVRLSLRKLFF